MPLKPLAALTAIIVLRGIMMLEALALGALAEPSVKESELLAKENLTRHVCRTATSQMATRTAIMAAVIASQDITLLDWIP